MAGTLDQVNDGIAEIRELMKAPPPPSNSGNIIQFHGSALGWTMAGVVIAALCLGALGIAIALQFGMSQRIGDMHAQIAADRVIAAQHKTEADARARTDRLLLNKLEVAIATKE